MAINDLPETRHTDSSGDQLVISSLSPNKTVAIGVDYITRPEVWLTEQQVKSLITDLASRIGCEVILFGTQAAAKIKALALDNTYPRDTDTQS